MTEKKQLEIELVRSVIGTPQWMRVVVRTMGLRKLRDRVFLPDNEATRGVIRKIPHLLKVHKAKE